MPRRPQNVACNTLALLLMFSPVAVAGSSSQLAGYCGVAQTGSSLPREHVSGYSDVANRRGYSLDTVQPIGSVSKPFIGLALAQLSKAGKLDLDAPIDAVLGWKVANPAYPNRPITLRQLATHSSGLFDDEAAYEQSYVPIDAEAMSLHDFLERYLGQNTGTSARSRFRKSAPGTAYEYSNIGAALAALAVERASGMPFADYVRARILAPLKMNDSGYPGFASVPPIATRATLYEGGLPVAPYRLVTYPDGGLLSTCADLQRFAQAVLQAANGKTSALDPAVVATMLAPQWKSSLPGAPKSLVNHGLFWEMSGSGSIGHTGGDPGLAALLAIQPRHSSTRIQLTNSGIDNDTEASEAFKARWKTLGEDTQVP